MILRTLTDPIEVVALSSRAFGVCCALRCGLALAVRFVCLVATAAGAPTEG